jgi:hypothetical protein
MKTCTTEVRDRGPGFNPELCGEPAIFADRCEKHANGEYQYLKRDLADSEARVARIKHRLEELTTRNI